MAPGLVEAMICPTKRLICVMPPETATGAASHRSFLHARRHPRAPQAEPHADQPRRDTDHDKLRAPPTSTAQLRKPRDRRPVGAQPDADDEGDDQREIQQDRRDRRGDEATIARSACRSPSPSATCR